MAPKRKTSAASEAKQNGNEANGASATPASPSKTVEQTDHEERALDPKLAEHPDESEEETSKPPAKKYKKSSKATDQKGSIDMAQNTVKKGYGADAYAKEGKGWHRSDFNPKDSSKTPLQRLEDSLKKHAPSKIGSAEDGRNVVYWMRMHDLRIHDNRALAHASELAKQRRDKGKGGNLIALHVISPGDFRAHDRSARRIDFVLRTLRDLERKFAEKQIPFVVVTVEPRTAIIDRVFELCKQWGAGQLTANIEYEVDELWRDAKMVDQAGERDVAFSLFHDCYVVPPGKVTTNDGRPYSVFSPWNRKWTDILSKDMSLLDESPEPEPNDKAIRQDKELGALFDLEKLGDGYGIPDQLEGFECADRDYMAKLWPVEGDAAKKVLDNFMEGKGGKTILDAPANEGSENVGANSKESRIGRYSTGRNLVSENGTSRISPYLAAGLVSPRECLRRTMAINKNRLHVGRDSGVAMWNTEVSFRDFYGHVLAAWPKVCMGHAFITKYEDVKWETDSETLQAWKEGRTGYPIVDAAQRQCIKQGYIHNRGRMISAMFLTKHLLHDWREGERHFSLNFVDQDFASNNGGWQWSASTGTDPQPYFRIFNPLSQSEKSDPDGEYIRHFVPELRNVKGNAIHDPFNRLSPAEFKKLGYPKPIVEHKQARERALRRFKNPGDE
ncbi:related to deoxyribodipyrimidine photo-lyase PHR [Pseudozyma flocculosa]|uniref:Related to deoxyribodipyrimidine photo-lyase PHR n=2 Tax=Pseudozyma flocculosa TaxID=84751 RepID=A0A5C3EZA6_9BASI|nr:related to deoxyribodipyrimidine photo-lyase PHR [Pseudozyma flocculosa]